MSILNLSTGRAKKYCRACLATKVEYSFIHEARDVNYHIESLSRGISDSVLAKYFEKHFGIKHNHSLQLQNEQYFDLFNGFPFDILHSVYLGHIKHALKDTIRHLSKQQERLFLS